MILTKKMTIKAMLYYLNHGIIKIDFVSFNRMILFCWEND